MIRMDTHPTDVDRLKTRSIDIVSSFLLASLSVIGCLVLLLFMVWLTSRSPVSPPSFLALSPETSGREKHAPGFQHDIEAPGEEETEELSEPSLAATLQVVTEKARAVATSMEGQTQSSRGKASGDKRLPGPEGEGEAVVPRFERWDLKFRAPDMNAYAAQLDYFGIELGCIGGGIAQVDYAFDFASSIQRRSGTSTAENERQRLFFFWRADTKLLDYELLLLEKARIPTENRQILKFIPQELERQLAEVEYRYAQERGREIREIQKTTFESRSSPTGFEFVIVDQLYVPKAAG